MSRLHEDPATRRVVDTDTNAYRLGVRSANWLIDNERERFSYHVLSAETLMEMLLAEDPEVEEHWGMYLMLKAMLDTFYEYRQERST